MDNRPLGQERNAGMTRSVSAGRVTVHAHTTVASLSGYRKPILKNPASLRKSASVNGTIWSWVSWLSVSAIIVVLALAVVARIAERYVRGQLDEVLKEFTQIKEIAFPKVDTLSREVSDELAKLRLEMNKVLAEWTSLESEARGDAASSDPQERERAAEWEVRRS